jgi:arginase
MKDRHILTAYFLDEPFPDLAAALGASWEVNRPPLPDGDPQARMSVIQDALAEKVEAAVRAGERPVSLAGDCCATFGVVAGLQRAGLDPALIWFDAHGDFNTWETTPSGFLGGMPLAMLVGRGEQTMPAAVGLRPLAEERVILAGARDLDPEEGTALRGSRVAHLPDVAALRDHPLPAGDLYVHFDTDVIDPAEAPAMGYPAAGGPSAAELAEVFRYLHSIGRVRAVSVSSWNPALDEDGRTARVCMDALRVLLEG